jgi:hypothetical protein
MVASLQLAMPVIVSEEAFHFNRLLNCLSDMDDLSTHPTKNPIGNVLRRTFPMGFEASVIHG